MGLGQRGPCLCSEDRWPGQDRAEQGSTRARQTRPSSDPHLLVGTSQGNCEIRSPPPSLPCHLQCSKDIVGIHIPRCLGREGGRVDIGKTRHLPIRSSHLKGRPSPALWGVTPGQTQSLDWKETENHRRLRSHEPTSVKFLHHLCGKDAYGILENEELTFPLHI